MRLVTGPKYPRATFLFAHGAGAPMDTPFMTTIADGLAARKIETVRFEFPYMAARRTSGKRRGPGSARALQGSFRDEIERLETDKLFIGGKYMGGRVASMLVDQGDVCGLICLGFPFHAAGRPLDPGRLAALEQLRRPALICQGTRDTMGSQAEVAAMKLSTTIQWQWLEDGDHSFKPRKSSGLTLAGHLAAAVEAIDGFVTVHV